MEVGRRLKHKQERTSKAIDTRHTKDGREKRRKTTSDKCWFPM
jgi:hypothetical protein